MLNWAIQNKMGEWCNICSRCVVFLILNYVPCVGPLRRPTHLAYRMPNSWKCCIVRLNIVSMQLNTFVGKSIACATSIWFVWNGWVFLIPYVLIASIESSFLFSWDVLYVIESSSNKHHLTLVTSTQIVVAERHTMPW